ncbi:MAG: DNA alkylation repair protein [Sediminibacterium sp.]
MHPYLRPIEKKFKHHADSAKAVWMKGYLLNQFEFYGLQAPGRSLLCKEHYKQYPIADLEELEIIVKECFSLPQREYQYFAIGLFAYHSKIWKAGCIKTMEYCLLQKSWWDSVDGIASEWLGPYFKMFPGKIMSVTSRWNRSKNMWLQRSSIMFQKACKKETDTSLLSRYILNCTHSEEFFIQKAIGWALREYSKTDPVWVQQFVKGNKLASLSVREALKRINKKK